MALFTRRRSLAVVVLVAVVGLIAMYELPQLGAGGLLYPARRTALPPPPDGCAERQLTVADVDLRGWHCPASGPRQATIVYLHGIADNRASGTGVIRRYVPRGFDVVAYDSRRHGTSGGDACTYGVREKHDLRTIIDSLGAGPFVLLGTSLGAAVALQEAADDPRVSLVVAAEVFSDLETVARERAPALMPRWSVDRAFRIAEQRAAFSVAEASPERAATRIHIPVLLIHGAADHDTLPRHSERVFAALAGPKRLLLVDGAGHNESLNQARTWNVIDEWIARVDGGAQ
jgi:uncharacterized protein